MTQLKRDHGKEFGETVLWLSLILAIVMGSKGIADAINDHGARCVPQQREGLGEG